ncbi:MAG: hypothetical protein IT168_11700 [Bryobacterales bacterium]|nr:hypothetical protein [Bryobacterales bacterium]
MAARIVKSALSLIHHTRSALAVILVFTLAAGATAQQSPSAEKLRRQLSKIPLNAEIEMQLLDGSRVRGTFLGMDQDRVKVSTRSAPVPIAEIKAVKRIRTEAPVWSPVWGFARTWKTAAITLGVVLLVGIFVAKNTR